MRFFTLLFCFVTLSLSAFANAEELGVTPETLVVVVNADDPDSMEVGRYYRNARHIPKANLIKVHVPQVRSLTLAQFEDLHQQINAKLSDKNLGDKIQAMVLIWTTPYAVGCNSITSALTLGFDAKQCENTCGVGKPNPYFDSPSRQPYQKHDMRISMLLPVESVAQAKALIDRGVLSAFKLNEASAYFVETSDKLRSSRAPFFPPNGRVEGRKLEIKTLKADFIEDKSDVMFYFTGAVQVPRLETLTFLPGALADHLTSTGGDLLDTGQMSSLRWLQAGATASYGTVSEPCNYWQKFPNPLVVLKHYVAGETAIEAYWKSVAWPAQGVFIGEPLAAPYAR